MVLLVNTDFLPLLGTIKSQLTSVRKLVLITDEVAAREDRRSFDAEYEELLAAHAPEYAFPDFDENTRATTFYTPAPPACPKASISATGNWCCTRSPCSRAWQCRLIRVASIATMCTCPSRRCFTYTPGVTRISLR